MSIDDYLDREYDIDKFNCGHFVAQVWRDLTGRDISGICSSFVTNDTEFFKKENRKFKHLHQPESPCVVLMRAPNVPSHAGIYVDAKVLHLTESGVRYESLDMLKPYWRLSFYK